MMDKYEVATLAEDYEAKRRTFEAHRLMNVPTDPEKARDQSIAYHIAEAEMLEAYRLLERAKMR